MISTNETLFDKLNKYGELLADKSAFTYIEDNSQSISLTFSELNARVSQLAHIIATRACVGERVVLLLPQGMDYVVTFLACLRAGVVAVPLYPPLSRNQSGRVVKVVKDCDATMVLTNQRLFEAVDAALEHTPEMPELVCVNALSAQVEQQTQLPQLQSDMLAFLQYTSGSTGTPKGVMISHSNILANTAALVDATGCGQEDIFCNWLPLFHDLGLVNTLLLPIYLGAHSVLMSPARFVKRPACWFEAIASYRATICGAPNFAYDLCVKRLKTDRLVGLDLSCWQRAFTAAEPIDSDTLDKFERKFAAIGFKPEAWLAAYGMAEATVFISANQIRSANGVKTFDPQSLQNKQVVTTDEGGQSLVACGHATEHHELLIVCPQTRQVLPECLTGEIWFAGPSVAKGYWQDEEKTKATFGCALATDQAGRYLRTGDAGFMWQGQLFISGRLKDILIINGRNYYPQDLEKTCFDSHEALVDFAAVAFESKGQVVLVQEVARKYLQNLDFAKVVKTIEQHVFEQFELVVADVVLLRAGHLSRTSSGKVQRSLTSKLYAQDELPRLNAQTLTDTSIRIAPQTATEKRLAEIWGTVLGIDSPSLNDNFFALGGQSVTALYLSEQIFAAFGVKLSPRSLFEYPELSELASFIETLPKKDSSEPSEAARSRYKATAGQQQIWLEQQMAPSSTRYHLSECFVLTGRIDIERLKTAFECLVGAHDILRTRYCQGADGLYAQVAADIEQPLVVMPVTEQTIAAQIKAFAAKPFDLSCDMPLRACLFVLSDNEAQLMVTGHHIAMDGGSYQRLVSDLSYAYQHGELPHQPSHFAEFAANSCDDSAIAEAKSYWQQQLEGIGLTHNLPLDNPRSSTPDYHGDRYILTIDAQLSQRVEAFARQKRLSLFTVMHGALCSLLRRHSGDDDVVLGITVAERDGKMRDAVGYFVNTLVTRSAIDFKTSFDDLLDATSAQLSLAYRHAGLSFNHLVETINPPRVAGLNPLFQVLFGFDDSEQTPLQLGELECRRIAMPTEQVMTDLAVHLARRDHAIELRFDYATALFERETIVNMANRLPVILQAMIAASNGMIDQCPLLSEADKQSMDAHNELEQSIDDVALLLPRFDAQAQQNPQAIALTCEGQQYSYQTLQAKANRLAHYLVEKGVKSQECVGVCLNRQVELVVALLAVMKAGAAYLPLDGNYPAQRLSYMTEHAKVKLVLTETELQHCLSGAAELLLLDQLTALSQYSEQSDGLPTIAPEDLAYVIFTSGSTGNPKGVMIEHRNIAARIEWAGDVYDAQELSAVLAVSSVCFDLSAFELFVPLCYGGQVVLVKDALAVESGLAVSLVNTVPSVIKTWLTTNALPKSAKTVNIAGEFLDQSVVDKLYAQGVDKVYDLYGPSEDTTYSTFVLRQPNGRNSIGKALRGTITYLLNSQQQSVPKGVVGELYLAGKGLARGYLNQPELTKARFLEGQNVPGGRLYRTGDLMRVDSEGLLQYIGRNEHMVKVRGFRVELGEVESWIRRFDGVADATVLADSQAQQLVAYVIGDIDNAQLLAFLSDNLPPYMVPGDIIPLARWPLTPNGKLDRKALPKANFQPLGARQYQLPRTELEAKLLTIWQGLLNREDIGIDDNFFVLGGHSLLAARLVWQIEQQLNIAIGLDDVMRHQTVAELAALAATRPGLAGTTSWQRPADAPLTLSSAQRRLWLIDQIEPGKAQYNMPLALSITGHLDVAALGKALNALLERYGVLRSIITSSDNGQPVVAYHPTATISLEVDENVDMQQWLVNQATAPFDLSRDLLLRAALLRVEPTRHVLALTVHHIAADGHSMTVLSAELAALYEAEVKGQGANLPAVVSDYQDYAWWQNAQPQPDLDKAQTYWREQLAELPQVHNLPLDHARPVQAQHQGRYHYQRIDTALAQQLNDRAKAMGGTLFVLLQSAFACLLGRHSGQNDIVMGTPVINRDQSQWADTVGFFADTQMLRSNLQDNPGFADLVRRNGQWLQNCLGSNRLCYDALVDLLAPQRSLAYNPLFQILIVMQPSLALRLPGLEVQTLEPTRGISKYDLTLTIAEAPEGLQLSWEYDSALFKPATIERMAQHFAVILAAVGEQPDTKVKQLPLFSANEQQQISQWLSGKALTQPAQLLHRGFEQQAEQNPDNIAFYGVTIDGEHRTLSYGELNRRANRLAHRLVADGVGPDQPVVICLDRHLDLAVAVLAVLKAGGAYVAVDPKYPQARIAHIIEDAEANWAITQSAYESLVGTAVRYCVDKPDWLALSDGPVAVSSLAPSNLAYMIYTSGSTGRPKGVMIEHQNAHALVCWAHRVFDPEALSCVLASTSMCFDLSIFEWFVPLSAGFKVALVDDALTLLDSGFNLPVTLVNTVPSAIKALVADHGLPSTVTTVNLAGEPLAQSLVEQLYQAGVKDVFDLYGPSEDTTYSTWTRRTQGGYANIGRPVDGTVAVILDDDSDQVPLGTAGQLYLSGAGLSRGYRHQPQLTQDSFITRHGTRYYRTGDLVKLNEDGLLCYIGRVDHQVKLRGFRIELGEIESVLRTHQDVSEAVVVARDNHLFAYLVGPSEDIDWQAFAQRSLPGYMVPNAFMVLPQLPLTANGKLDRKALPEIALESKSAYRAPTTEVEQALCALWQEVLDRDSLGIEDNFFSLGGDSILAIMLISRAAQAGYHFSAEDLFAHQTIARLAPVVTQGKAALVLAAPETDEQLLLPIQQRFIDGDKTAQNHYNQSVLLQLNQGFKFDWLAPLVGALFAQQAVLRLRVDDNGARYIAFAAAMVDEAIEYVDLAQATQQQVATAIASHGEKHQGSLSLGQGPLFKAVYFDHQTLAPKLLLIAHHMIVDGVSWRVLLRDWQAAIKQLQQGQSVAMPQVSHSYQQWAQQLHLWAQSEACMADKDYWLAQLSQAIEPLPQDNPSVQDGSESQTATFSVRLGRAHTEQLLLHCHHAYHTRIDDLLLTGLCLALKRFSGNKAFRLALESHGRHDVIDGMDIAGTMGWFTNLYPQTLLLAEGDEIGEAIMSVKEQLRALPNHGMSFGLLYHTLADEQLRRALPGNMPQVVFNYLGQAALAEDSHFTLCDGYAGHMISPNRLREFELGFNGLVKDGELTFAIDYNQAQYEQSSIATLGGYFQQLLAQIIDHCLARQSACHTPSDFPLAGVERSTLQALQTEFTEIADLYPSTPIQQGMLFHSEVQNDAYVVQLQIQLAGALNDKAFEQAWEGVGKRHAVMRTAFVDDNRLQLVLSHAPLNWQVLDWQDKTHWQYDLAQLCEADKAQGFAHDRAPLMRWTLIHLSAEHHLLVWSNHHALIDGWSLPVVFEEVMHSYQSILQAQTPSLLPVADYRQYLVWLSQQDTQAARTFWQAYLAKVESQTRLGRSEQGRALSLLPDNAEVQLNFSAAQAQQLSELAKRHQVTLNTVVQAAWAYLLHRYSDEATICFGETVSGRPPQLPQVERIVGLFINSLPVRVAFDENLRLGDWLKQLHKDASQRNRYGYLSLTDIQQLSPLGNRSALFDSLVVFENYPINRESQALSPLKITEVVGDDQTNYGLTLVVMPEPQMTFTLNYRTDKFSAETAEQLLDSLEVILQGMVSGCEYVAALPVVTAQREQQLPGRCTEQQTQAGPLLVHQLFERRADAQPMAIAGYCEGRNLSYGELNRLANRLARKLVANGLQANQPVGLCVKRSVDILVGMLGILKAGGGYLPLDPDYPQARLDHMIADAGAAQLVIESDLLSRVDHSGRTLVILDDHDSRSDLDDSNIEPNTLGLLPEHLAYVIYTSGSTGQPKGVMIEHQAIAVHTKLWAEHIGLQGDDKVIQFASISFDGAPEAIFSALHAGSQLFLRENVLWSSSDFYRYCQTHGITVADLPPAFALHWLQSHCELSEAYWRNSPMRLLCLGGDVLNLEIIRHLKALGSQCRLVNAYGPTEATVTATTYELSDHQFDTSVPIGSALAQRQLYVLDSQGRLMPPGAVGELYIGGPCLARGYLNQPEMTAKAFLPDPFSSDGGARMYKTGDLVAWLDDGNLQFFGRCDGQVKIRGFRVELSEVEAAVLAHEKVAQAAVIYHSQSGQLVAYVSADETDGQTWLRADLAKTLPAHMVPAMVIDIAQMPMTISAKIDRKALPAPESISLTRPYVAPQGETEQHLADIFAQLLEQSPISATDNFFDIGGHSLLLGQLAAQLSLAFGLEVSIRDLYERQTIRDIAQWLDTEILLLDGLFAEHDSEQDETQTWEI